MKFSNGRWLPRDGVTLYSPAAVSDVRASSGVVTVFAPVKTIASRGDTVDMPQLTVELDAPLPDVVRVRLYHFKGGTETGPHFDVASSAGHAAAVIDTCDEAGITSGGLRATVQRKGEWRLDFAFNGERITGSGRNDAGWLTDGDGESFIRERLSVDVGECLYGLGERFTAFVKNGQVVDIWNEDGGTASELAYKNIPFYLSSRGYGVLVSHPEKVSFEVASEVVSRVQFSVPGEKLEYYVIGGGTPKAVLRRYTELTGRSALPPAWSFGLWLTTSFTTDYDEETVRGFVEGMRTRGIPLHVFHFDCFWMKEFQWCDLEWDRVRFPDPEGFVARLKAMGLRISLWMNPYIAQKSALFEEGAAAGYLVMKTEGGVFQWDKWQAGMGLVDFTNPDAVRWYTAALRKLLVMGVDSFKTDFGERIPVGVRYHDGSDPLKMHNYYPYLYNRAVFKLLEQVHGAGRAVVFARSATVGSQKYPVHWGGDSSATYDSMAETLRGGLSLGLSGFGFWSHDIGGFEGKATPDLYKRWAAFGLLSSHSRLHGYESYRVPWLFDEEAVDVVRFFTRLKCRLMPYLFAAAVEAARDGIPVMRAMMLEFPEDPSCAYLDRQYMLGGALLVAPVFRPDGSVTYYVPEGSWTHFLSGETIEGGRWRTERHGYLGLPLLARPGVIVATGANETRPDYDYADGVTYHLFPLGDGASASVALHADGGEGLCGLTVQRTGDTMIVQGRGSHEGWSLLLRGIPAVAEVEGGSWDAEPLGALVKASSQRLVIRLSRG